jgi:NAD(P)-dependent dehydrogenase (short-subunit alcohol dehydrogenase family)
VGDYGAVRVAVEQLAAEFGRIEVLVNDAGVETRACFLDITPEDWDRQIAVNLSGTLNCSQAAAREMARHAYGRIVNLSSVAARQLIVRPIAVIPATRTEGSIQFVSDRQRLVRLRDHQ